MECERLVEKIRVHAIARIQSAETSHGCRISLPLLEPNGDVITVTVEQGRVSDTYYVTDGGRLNGLLFESSQASPYLTDRRLVADIAKRATLEFDDDKRVYYATADSRTLGYWAFEVGRTIATVASMIPQARRRRAGSRLSKHVMAQLEKELDRQGLRKLLQGPRHVRGITNVDRRVDLSYRTRRVRLGDQDHEGTVFVIVADIGVADPMRSAGNTIIVAHDLSALEGEPTTRIVHGVARTERTVNGRTEQARRLIESVASTSPIEQYSWDDNERRNAFVSTTRDELAAMAETSLATT